MLENQDEVGNTALMSAGELAGLSWLPRVDGRDSLERSFSVNEDAGF